MSSSSFNETILAEKLSKLNASQQSIETLSNWCIFHRKRASQVVVTWQKEFFKGPLERRLPLLYLANDILQNSRKKGPEFISEFWRALPPVLKDLIKQGPEKTRNSTYRIIDIWEERKVFGQREETLRTLLLGSDLATVPPSSSTPSAPQPTSSSLSPAPSYSQPLSHSSSEKDRASAYATPKDKDDEASPKGYSSYKPPAKVRGALERIANAYSSVQDSSKDEDTAFRRCTMAVSEIVALEKDISAVSPSDPEALWAPLRDRLDTKLALLGTCCELLSSCEQKRSLLVKLLKEALSIQESKLDRLQSQLQVGRAHAHIGSSLKSRIPPPPPPAPLSNDTNSSAPAGPVGLSLASSVPPNSSPLGVTPPLPQESTAVPASLGRGQGSAGPLSAADELMAQKRQVAAQLAAKVKASTASAAILSAVLSSLAAKGASMSASSSSSRMPAAPAPEIPPPEKRIRLETAPATNSTQVMSPSPAAVAFTPSGIPLPPDPPLPLPPSSSQPPGLQEEQPVTDPALVPLPSSLPPGFNNQLDSGIPGIGQEQIGPGQYTPHPSAGQQG